MKLKFTLLIVLLVLSTFATSLTLVEGSSPIISSDQSSSPVNNPIPTSRKSSNPISSTHTGDSTSSKEQTKPHTIKPQSSPSASALGITTSSTQPQGYNAFATHYWNDGVTIEGFATDGRNYIFPYVTVYLFLNQSKSTFSIGTANQTAVADGTGFFQFPLAYNQAQLAKYNYSVWYPDQDTGDPGFGIACFNCAKTVANGTYVVYDRINFYNVLDSPIKIGPADPIDFRVIGNRTNAIAVPVNVLSQLSFSYNINFIDDPVSNNGTQTKSMSTEIVSVSDGYSGSSATNVTISFSVNLGSSFPSIYQVDTANLNTLALQISTDFTFTVDNITLNGAVFNPANDFAYRNNQNVQIMGRFYSAANGVSPTLWTGITIHLDYSGSGAVTQSSSNTTDSNGYYVFNFVLSTALFNSAQPGDIKLVVTNTDPNGVLGSNNVITKTIRLIANATTLSSPAVDKTTDANRIIQNTLYHYNDGVTFTVSGQITDENTNPAQGVQVALHINDQNIYTTPGTDLYWGTKIPGVTGVVLTDVNGLFSIPFTLPDIKRVNSPMFSVNVTIVGRTATNSTYRWVQPTSLEYTVFTFSFLQSDSMNNNILFTYQTSTTAINSTFATQFLDNITYFNEYQNAANNYYFAFTIRDSFGRIPLNVNFNIAFDENAGTPQNELGSRNVTSFLIDATNQGIFKFYFANLTQYNLTPLHNLENTVFKYHFVVGNNTSFYSNATTYGREFTIYGPDNHGVDPNNIDVKFIPSTPQESPHNLTVYWSIPVGVSEAVFVGNLRDVIISYRATPTGYNSTRAADYFATNNPAWTNITMFYNNGLNRFEHTFLFSSFGNGVFFQVVIYIKDLSGFGIDQNGNTFGGGTWAAGTPDFNSGAALPGYNTAVTNVTTVLDNGTVPFSVKMGDTVIYKIDLANDVRVNGNKIANGFNITRLDQDITIDLYINQDAAGYANVTLYYRLLQNETNTGFIGLDNLVFNSTVQYKIIQMTLLGTQGGILQYQYLIDKSELFFGAYLDFYFYLQDVDGLNSTTKPFVSSSGTPQNTVGFSVVVDLNPPVELFNDFSIVRIGGRDNGANLIVIYSNEDVNNFNVTYILADINGTGLSDVTITWFMYDLATGTLIQQLPVTYFQNGLVVDTGLAKFLNGNLTLNLTIPASLFIENVTLSYVIEATDFSGNTLQLNQQDNNPNQYEIIPFPVPPTVDPSILTGSGTVQTTSQGGNRALWIVAGFILILAILTLYYQRNNIREILERRARVKRVTGTLSELNEEIRRLGAEMKFRRAILLIWEGLERVSREILQAPRRYNQTAKEFAYYLSTITIVDRDTLLTLSSSFEVARYGKDEPSRDDFEDAVKAFDITVKVIADSGLRTRVAEDDEDW